MANNFSPKKERRGLSRLQRHILDLAEIQGGEVLACDILVSYYGFRPYRVIGVLRQGAHLFRKSEIGPACYNAATVAVCKAFNRLCERGLVKRIDGGIIVD
jgi:hypothetical protein